MGLTKVKMTIANPLNRKKKITRDFLVDSGATYSTLPKSDLDKLGIKSMRKMDFSLADGRIMTRELGEAFFEYRGTQATSPVIIGEENDLSLLGAVTLENMGMILNPFTRDLYPIQAVAR